MALKKAQEREYAKILFLSENLTQKALAERVGVTEKTIKDWITKGGWDKIRRSKLTSRQHNIDFYYDQLERINADIAKRDPALANTSDTDMIVKFTTAINKLETETGVGETYQVGREYIELVSSIDLDFAKKSTEYFDILIQNKMKK